MSNIVEQAILEQYYSMKFVACLTLMQLETRECNWRHRPTSAKGIPDRLIWGGHADLGTALDPSMPAQMLSTIIAAHHQVWIPKYGSAF